MINKKILLIITVCITVGFGLFVFVNQKNNEVDNDPFVRPTYSNSKEYRQSIDYSCSKNSDCVIKDVHNCCGYDPRCVNKNATVDPDFVRQSCSDEGVASVCGFPSINSCKCVNSKCEGFFKE